MKKKVVFLMFVGIILLTSCFLNAQEQDVSNKTGFDINNIDIGKVLPVENLKKFFNYISNQNYQEAWNMLDDNTKNKISEEISKATNGLLSSDRIKNLLNKNINDILQMFFEHFKSNLGEYAKIISTDDFSVKQVSQDEYDVTVKISNEPRVIKVKNENGSWKVDFLNNLFK